MDRTLAALGLQLEVLFTVAGPMLAIYTWITRDMTVAIFTIIAGLIYALWLIAFHDTAYETARGTFDG